MPLIIFFVSLIFLNVLENGYRPYTHDGAHFQQWTSGSLQQTLPIQVLKNAPIQSLWYLHKQPPTLDFIRAVLAQLFRNATGKHLLQKVDAGIYYIWSLFFAGMATIIYCWMRKLTNRYFALVAVLSWVINPAPIFYATLLDGTFMSSFFILWFLYELWQVGKNTGSIVRLSLASVLLLYTRTVFQWYFFPILLCSLILLKMPIRRVYIFIGIVSALASPLIIKQYLLFGTTSTTTFAGYHKCGVIWYQPSKKEIEHTKSLIKFKYPDKAAIYSGNDKFNNEKQYQENLIYSAIFKKRLKTAPMATIKELMRSLKWNSRSYWRPSAKYVSNIIPDHLVWADLYNAIFSCRIYLELIFFSLIAWLWTYKKEESVLLSGRKTMGMLMPVLYIFLITNLCNRYGWTEAVRLKFLLEPFFYIFITSQIYIAITERLKKPRRKDHADWADAKFIKY